MKLSWGLFSLASSSVAGSAVTKLYPASWGCVSVEVGRQTKRYYSRIAALVDLSGVFPPIPTPFNEDESIAYDKLARNIQHWEKIPFQGYVVQGSNGEYPLMTSQERVEMVSRVRQLIAPDRLLIAGSSCESTRNTVELSNKMAAAGANAVMVVNPSYYKNSMTAEALIRHYKTVADLSSIPVIVYNMPANTGIDLTADIITQLAEHPNIIGLKDSGGDIAKISRVVSLTRHYKFQVLAGSTGFLLPALLVGCVGGINALANILGDEVCDIYKFFTKDKLQEAVELHLRLVTPNAMVTRELGVPAMKEAMNMMGLYGGPCRQPLQPLTDSERRRVRDAFIKNGFHPKC
ncbi:4-hydroxy-2-oxoglutarate aldolase, mitochondrial-like isoform X1 [Cryptotermes secundus]|uniref:4-hydroxy-2-oxoglutarate aldolase, mitochondrial-like isoform X1 n=1 Tax=Cryptotermes secundus TaxID=105785 RepID=UPI000CD7C61E|nr:4-hydroxy-2-oxoglutarate aldolase, mitochondrial-like isoform X1 [Cryptotermes secundus]